MKVYEFTVHYQDDYITVEAENEDEAWELANEEAGDLLVEPDLHLENPDWDD